jgi:hypothetical protein
LDSVSRCCDSATDWRFKELCFDSWQRRDFYFLCTASRPALGAHLASYSVGTGGFLTCLQIVRSQEYVELYIHSPIHLHGVVLDWLSTGTTLRFYLYWGLGLESEADHTSPNRVEFKNMWSYISTLTYCGMFAGSQNCKARKDSPC